MIRSAPVSRVRGIVVCAAMTLAVPAAPVSASTDLVATSRAPHPDRLWTPLTAADLASAGAGRAVDPASSWTTNPALIARPDRQRQSGARLGGSLIDPRRGDVQSETDSYSDDSPHFALGETGLSLLGKRLSYGATYAFDSYEKESAIFTDPESPEGFPVSSDNLSRGSLERLSVAVAMPFGEAIVAGAALEGYRSIEEFEREPLPASAQLGVQTARQRLSGRAAGGALGAHVRAQEWLAFGVAGRIGGSIDLEDEAGAVVGTDEVSPRVDFGIHAGRGSGGNLLLSAGWTGERAVALGDSIGRGEETASSRADFAAAYAYESPAQPWEFRIGFGWSPHPSDGGARATRFGIGLGWRLDSMNVRLSYGREARSEGEDDFSRQFLTAGVDLEL